MSWKDPYPIQFLIPAPCVSCRESFLPLASVSPAETETSEGPENQTVRGGEDLELLFLQTPSFHDLPEEALFATRP